MEVNKSKILAYNIVKRIKLTELNNQPWSNLEIAKWIEEINIEKKLELNL